MEHKFQPGDICRVKQRVGATHALKPAWGARVEIVSHSEDRNWPRYKVKILDEQIAQNFREEFYIGESWLIDENPPTEEDWDVRRIMLKASLESLRKLNVLTV